MGDYRVRTKVRFGTGFDTGEMNGLFFEQAKPGLTKRLMDIFRSRKLAEYVPGDVTVTFAGTDICLDYIFACWDENAREAESFSRYLLRHESGEDFEEHGFPIKHIWCKAGAVSEEELAALEEQFFA